MVGQIRLPSKDNYTFVEFKGLDLWKVPGTNLKIIRMSEGEMKGEYLFSSDTVSSVTDSYDRVKHLPIRMDGPKTSPGI